MVSSAAELGGLKPIGGRPLGWDSERWVFLITASVLFLVVMAGFIPSSIGKIAAVRAGQRAEFLPILHVHAVLMGSWILLLLTQTSLVATDNHRLHKKLGLAAMGLVPAMVITGFLLVPASFGLVWSLDPAVVPAEFIASQKVVVSNIALAQIRIGILFPLFVGLALHFRNKDAQTHKRLMILATVLPLPAAIDRITWLPNTMPDSPIAPDLYVLLLVLPMFIVDLMRNRGIPRAYSYWLAGFVPTSIILNLLWNSDWWLSAAPRIMGVAG